MPRQLSWYSDPDEFLASDLMRKVREEFARLAARIAELERTVERGYSLSNHADNTASRL